MNHQKFSKVKSRTFLFAVVWTLGTIVAIVLIPEALWIGNLITFAGGITVAYIGKNAYVAKVRESNNNNNNEVVHEGR